MRWILLSAAEPMGLSPGWSHFRPTRESQPSGFRRSAVCSVRQAEFSFCQEFSCGAASAGSSANRRAMKVSQAERSLKRTRKYNVEGLALKMEDEEERACLPILKTHGRRSSWNWSQLGKQQKYSCQASLFPIRHTVSSGSPLV